MNIYIKRAIAGVLSAVLFIGLINLPALSLSLASELSGYAITVEYSDDNTSALLAGDTSEVREDVQLNKLVDSQGQELDPYGLYQTVEENGTYHFTLYYQETVDTQDADQPTTEEKVQELEVVVDGIGKPQADQPAPTATPEVQEGVVMGGEAEKDGPPPFVEKDESMTAAPRTVPLDLLQRSTAQTKASKTVHIYADEAEYKISEAMFTGGPLVAGAAGLPTVDGRTFAWADYIIDGSTISRTINGLYFYNNQWYYTVGENSVDGGNAGTMYLGFELPANATVRLHYKITATQKYQLDAYGSGADLASGFQMYLNGKQNYRWLMYPQGTKIVLDFVMPVTLSGLNISISNVGDFNISSAKELGNNALTEKQIWRTANQTYTLVFTMPAKQVSINFNGTAWTDSDIRNFALGSDFTPKAGESYNNTQHKDYANTWGSFFRSMPWGAQTSPGIVNSASVGHTDNELTYSPRPTVFQVYNQGSSTGTKGLQFAQGSFKSNQLVGFELRMDRRAADGSYAWKANSLIMNVYIGEEYTWDNKNFRQYTIKLAHTDVFGTESTRDTYLDCGARVRTQCWQWDENSYYYKIYVYNMAHNFTLYDRPVKTNTTNFVIAEMNGFEAAEPGNSSSGNLGVSFATNKDVYDGSYYPIHEADDWTYSWLGNVVLNDAQKQLYLRPKYGYTAPTGVIRNAKSLTNLKYTSLTPLGQTLQSQGGQSFYIRGLYHFVLQSSNRDKQGNGGQPVELAFNSVPMQLQLKYREDGKDYFDPGVTLSASGNSSYTLLEKLGPAANGRKLKGYEIKISVSFYKNNDTSGKLYTEDVKISSRDDETNGYWYPNQIITFADVYDALQGMGKLTINEISTLRINPVYVSAGETPVQAKLEIKEQTKFANLDNSTANKNLTAGVNASSTVKNINAYAGSTVSLYGNKDKYEKNGKKYLYNASASRPSGTVTASNPIVASLEYVLATTVTVDVNTLGSGNNGSAWNTSQQNIWYTSINNFSHSFSLAESALKPGTKDGQIFTGWGIRKSNNEVVAITSNMMYNNSLNFYLLGSVNSALWSDIFNNGTCTLVAMWRSDVSPVTLSNGSLTNQNSVVYFVENQNTLAITAEFKYGDGSATLAEIQELFSSNKLKIALIKKRPPSKGVEWEVRFGPDSPISNNFSGPVITKDDGTQTFKVTFTVEGAVTAEWNDGANFRIFAWTDGNDGTANLTSAAIATALMNADSSVTEGGQYVNPYEGQIPSVNVESTMLQEVTLADGSITNQNDPDVYFVENQNTLAITAEFKYGDGTATLDEIQEMFDADALKIALIKKRPPSKGVEWEVRFGPDSPISNNFSGPVITKDDGTQTFKVTFTVEGAVAAEWNDGANFRIFAWTDDNNVAKDLASADIADALMAADAAVTQDSPYENPYEGQMSSVNVESTMLQEVTLADGSISNQNDPDIYFVENQNTLSITAEFKYGDGTATLDEIQAMFDANALKIAMIKKRPPSKGVEWEVRFGPDSSITSGFAGPFITKDDGTQTFKVTFRVEGAVGAEWNNGANFRIFVWTDVNGGTAGLTSANIASALMNADSAVTAGGQYENPYEGQIPSVNVESTMLYKVTDKNGNIGSVADENVLVNDGGSLTLEAQFRYGDGTADEANLQTLFADGELHIALLKVDPEIWPQTWRVLTSNDIVSGPAITKEAGVLDFKISFQVSNAVGAWFDDGAQFRIYVWTDANGSKENGASVEAGDIANILNQTPDTEQPNITGIPLQHFNISLLYKVIAYGESTSNVTLLSTSTNIPLSAMFKYNFDAGRYPNGYNGGRIMDLITNGDISATLEYKKSGEESWTSVTLEVGALTVMDAAKGLIRFDYSFTPEDGDLSAFDGAEFKIKVQSKANDTPAEHTVMVTYVSDPTAYVNIPKYIILDDNNSNVTVGDVKQDGYAGKLVEVTYNDATMEGDFKPDIEVKVQDGVKMKEGSISGAEVSDMAIGIYNTSGLKLNEDTTDTGYCSVGTLSATNLSLPFWMNVKRSTVKDQQYYATVTFILKLSGITT